MFIRVNFVDNDFSTVVRKACEAIMGEISRGYNGDEALNRFEESNKRYGLEAIRKSIVLSAYGYYIAKEGARSYSGNQTNIFNVSQHEDILAYLDENVSIEVIKNLKQEWENCEVCYIDFYLNKVHLQ